VITFHQLRKRYGALPVLQGLDLRIERGSVTAIAGPNGSGKSTLLKILLGLVKADGGTVLVDGERVGDGRAGDGRASDGCRYRERIGYMPQAAHFPENLTGREVLRLLRELRGATDAEDVDEELVGLFRLEPELDKPVRTLSGGNRQKLSAVAAFLFRPDIVVMDEPTAGLDPTSSSTLKDKVLRERARGRTFILTSHVMSELEELSDRLVFLLDGAVHFEGTTASMIRTTGQATLERAIAQMMRREVAA
jgi:Cu-processing system ATP-binding protein